MKKDTKHIAARKRAEQMLADADDDKFKTIFDHASDGILLADLETKKFDMANKKICRMLGYSPKEITNLGVADIHPEKDLPCVIEQFEGQARGDFTLSKDLPVKRKDGSVFYANINSTVITVAGKKYLAGFFHDITEHKRDEKALRASEERHRRIIETMQEGFGEIDSAWRIVSANKRCAEMFGYTPDELIGLQMVEDLLFPIDREIMLEQMKQRRRDEANTYEQRFRRKDGEAVWIIVSGTPIKDESGAVRGSFAMMTDITKRKRTEEALRVSKEWYRNLFERSRDAIMTLEPPSWKFTTGNPAAIEMFKAKNEDEFTSYGPWILSPERQPDGRASDEKAKEMIAKAMREGFHFFEWTHQRISGEEFPATVLLSKTEQDEHMFLQATVRDITELKQAENEVRKLNVSLEERVQERTTELARANQELETLIRIASHDLRSPLVNIQGFNRLLNKACDAITRILADTILPDDTRQALVASHEKAEKAIRFINAGVEKMNGLISGLLHLSRLGRAPLALQSLEMNALLQTVLEAMAFQIRTAAAEVTVDALPDCRADAALISQVFSNLLDNAIKYRDSVRPLCVRVWGRYPGLGRHPGGDRREEDARAVYCVEDNGLGVATEHQQKIWDLFYRLNPQGSDAGEGIGLPSVQRIVARHGGTVWMESEIGKGSRFFLALPAAAKETEP